MGIAAQNSRRSPQGTSAVLTHLPHSGSAAGYIADVAALLEDPSRGLVWG